MKAGDRYGDLTVLNVFKEGKQPKALVKCSCGEEKVVFQSNLRSGATSSCRGCNKPKEGRVFGYLTVLEVFMHNGYKKAKCRCNCGKEIVAYCVNLRSGKTSSCGCFRIARVLQ